MKATVLVRPKQGILDPQGEATRGALQKLGFHVEETRVGRVFDLELNATDAAAAKAEIEQMCEKLLANPLIESYEIERGIVSEPRPKIAVVSFPGSLDDHDAVWALGALGADAVAVWHAEPALPEGTTAVVLPGGFSYGDYLRCGAIARFSPVMHRVVEFAEEGGLVLGICNGFQVLSEAGLVPGVLRQNRSLSFICRDVTLRVERTDTPFTSRCEPHQRLRIPIKNNEGCWFADDETVTELEASGQILLRYHGENPSGSVMAVAGVCNAAGNVMGLMPHPEHAVDPLLGSGDGALILASLVDAARERTLAALAA